jgi:hypothetical protein
MLVAEWARTDRMQHSTPLLTIKTVVDSYGCPVSIALYIGLPVFPEDAEAVDPD